MKRFIESLVCATVLLCMAVPAWGQASTQGKEFWVSSTLTCSPETDRSKVKQANPYIAISAEKACTITITGGEGGAINITQQVAAGSWNEFGNSNKSYNGTQPFYNTDPTKGPINVQMDASKWYPIATSYANDVINLKGQIKDYGLHITATENISVYVILSAENSMDASNILPVSAIGSEYYTQDYKPEANQFSNIISMITILATENGTQVDIIPKGATADGHAADQLFTIYLNQGQTYYLIGDVGVTLAGTHIEEKNGRKIAVFSGAPLTRVPNGRAARDCTFEQVMPTEYWGTQFIATRSLGKDGNLIGITATQRGTKIKVDGHSQAYINEGETYYIMLQNASDPWGNNSSGITSTVDQVITADAVYIETSCPCAVVNYDTGRDFKGSGTSEISGHFGDPSSVWVSPIQQKIGKITFGTCYTAKTEDHFLNVVTETATCQNTKLTAIFGATQMDKTSLLTWTPVPGNTKYSYARAKIGTAATKNFSVFRLENSKGFIATVYGNGDDESYAYSAGSSAVELGVDINGENFTNGYISDTRFCMGTTMNFDANLGGKYSVTRVDWNFGDGISEYNSTAQISHDYTVPGWYDVEADLWGKQVCTDDNNQWLGNLKFSFRIVRPDTVHVDSLFCVPESQTLPADEIITTDDGKCDTVYIIHKHYAKKSTYRYAKEEKVTDGYEMHGHWYTDPYQEDTFYVGQNAAGCDSFEICQLTLKMCLVIDLPEKSLHVCPGDPFDLEYSLTKGEMGEMRFISGSTNVVLHPSNGYVALPTEQFKPGKYQAKITVQDLVCEQTIEFPLDMTVNYSKDIFKFKFNNVLAVYNKDNNGGYEFVGYQWFYNGQPIEGATSSVYHSEVPLEAGEYYVLLTDANGLTMPSCVQKITAESIPDYSDLHKAPATKHLINRQIVIRKGTQSYNIYGQRIE